MHLQQYWPRIEKLMAETADSLPSVDFITQAGCPTLPGLNIRGRGKPCNELFDFAIERAFDPGVATVVFGAFWEDYFLGEYAVSKAKPKVFSAADADGSALTIDSPPTDAAFLRFEQIISRLIRNGRRVFIVLSNPTSPSFEVPFPPCLRASRSTSIPGRFPTGPRIDLRPYEAFAAPVIDRLRNIAARTGAIAVDPSATLCEDNQCASTDDDGMPRYIDSSHLRGGAAREHAGFIDEMLLGPSVEL
jgi:SGNH domain (fused to AT3 domains)